MPERKIIQIFTVFRGGIDTTVYALCNDGIVLYFDMVNYRWQRNHQFSAPVPQD